MTSVDGDIWRATCHLRSASGEDIYNVFHFKHDGISENEGSLAVSVLTVLDNLYDDIEPAIPSDVSFVDIDLANVTQGLVYPSHPWPVQTNGGGTGDTMPEQLCGNLYAGTAFPHTIGRKFFGPFIESNNTDGVWASGLLAALADAAVHYLADVVLASGGVLHPGVAKYVNGVVTRFAPLLSAAVSSGIFTQRRRRRGVGA